MRRGWMMLLALVIGLLPAIGALLPQPVLAADVVVGQGDYSCDRDGLAAAIDAADDGSTVTFDCAEPQIAITSVISITGSLTIDGSNGGNPIILDGGYIEGQPNTGSQIFNVDNTATLTLQHLTFQHGYTDGYGGAIDNDGTLTIIQSTFRSNVVDDFGGAIWNDGTMTISQSSFTDNSSGFLAGAIDNIGTLAISQSSFTNNAAGSTGGAIENGGTLTITSSTFSGNTAPDGSTFFIALDAETTTIRWSTIVQPQGTTAALMAIGPATLEGVILAGPGDNCAFQLDGDIDDSYTISDDASCGLNGEGSQPSTDPMLPDTPSTATVNGVEQTHYPLLAGSPAIDTGGTGCDTDGQPDFDQLNQLRPHGISYLCDIGAVEYWASNLAAISDISLTAPLSAFVGQPVTVEISASELSDQDDPDLYYWLDCDSDDSNELDYSGSNTTSCTYAAAGSYTIVGGVSDGGSASLDRLTIEVLPLDPVDLCANRWTGNLRMPPYGRCDTTETPLSITPDAPVTLCANRWTGDARYSRYGRCRTTESSYEANATDSVPVCINRWSGELRIDSRCYSTERSDQL